VSFRNRMVVFLSWAWSYFTQDKSMRYIIGKIKSPFKVPVPEPEVKATI
jgi:NADH dehydrogenase